MIGRIIAFIANIFRFHKFKLFFTGLSALFFFVVIFPYDDLSEVVTNRIAAATQNQLFLQFEDLGLQVLPFPALAINKVILESSMFPSIEASRIAIAPSLLGLLSFRPGVKIGAKGLWEGHADIDVKTGSKNDQGVREQKLQVELSEVDLSKIAELFPMPIKIQGKAFLQGSAKVDPSFVIQPDANINLVFQEARLAPGSLPTQMGPVNLPGLSWKEVRLQGRLVNSKLIIEETRLGKSSDPFNGVIKGEMDLKLVRTDQGLLKTVLGAYSFTLDLNINERTEKDIPMMGLLSAFRNATPTEARYRFSLSGPNILDPSSITISAPKN